MYYTQILILKLWQKILSMWGVFSLAGRLLGKWISAALKPVIDPVKRDVAHVLDNTFGNKVVNIKWRSGYRVDDIKWIVAENRPEMKWIYDPRVAAQEKRFWFDKNNHRFVEVVIQEV